jgi:uncharacterized membrane protein
MKKWLSLAFLLLLSMVPVAMVIVRSAYTGRISHFFLVWNLFLAWLPLLFAWLAYKSLRRPFLVVGLAFLWLLFFPNAPYLVTDLIHLRHLEPIPLWYDLILLFDFALVGLFLGLVSLRLMQAVVETHLGRPVSWLFVLLTLGISSLGVYIGRFLRWNSWDLFLRPLTLLQDVIAHLREPRTAAVSILLATMLLIAYAFLWLAPQIMVELQPQGRRTMR